MMSSRFDPGSTSKTLNLSLLRFNERSGFENLNNKGEWVTENKRKRNTKLKRSSTIEREKKKWSENMSKIQANHHRSSSTW